MSETGNDIKLVVDGADISDEITRSISRLAYIDNDGAHADDLQITTDDGSIFHENSRIELDFNISNWHGTNKTTSAGCGTFIVDEIADSGYLNQLTVKASAVSPESQARQSKKCQAWENITLKAIGETIAGRNGIKIVYDAKRNPKYTRREQIYQSDINFFWLLCQEAGLVMKYTTEAIVVYSKYEYAAAGASRVFERGSEEILSDMICQRKNDAGYGECKAIYTSPATKETISYTYRQKKGGRLMTVRRRLGSTAEARDIAEFALKEKNSREYAGKIECDGDPALISGGVVELSGYGDCDGKYIIEKAIHEVKGTVYTTTITIGKPETG